MQSEQRAVGKEDQIFRTIVEGKQCANVGGEYSKLQCRVLGSKVITLWFSRKEGILLAV
jgi:hypothetical protein